MVLTRSRISGYLDVVVMDGGVALVDGVLLVEGKGLRLLVTET